MPAERPQSGDDTMPWENASYRGICKRKKRSACKRSRTTCTYRKGSYTKSGKQVKAPSCAKKKMRRASRKPRRNSKYCKKNSLQKTACLVDPNATWVSGKKGSRVGYCRKAKRSRRKSRSSKKMRRASPCNVLKSGKKRSKKSCKRKKCTWRKGSKKRKGACVPV